jgi:hypothetical protein
MHKQCPGHVVRLCYVIMDVNVSITRTRYTELRFCPQMFRRKWTISVQHIMLHDCRIKLQLNISE